MFSVYNTCGYIELVGRTTELSMQAAAEEVKKTQDYATKGEVRKYITILTHKLTILLLCTVGYNRCKA